MGRELNITGVGGLLSVPSTKLEPRMDASAKVRIALPSGFVFPMVGADPVMVGEWLFRAAIEKASVGHGFSRVVRAKDLGFSS